MNVWDDLPNAKHIDFVIESVKKYPDQWGAAWNAAYQWGAARYAARNAADTAVYNAAYYATWDAVLVAARGAARDAARDTAYGAAYSAARDAAKYTAFSAAKDAILSLVVYDDCEQYLDMSYNELLFMAKLTQIPATILLLPYAKAMELIKEIV
jgi:hypothetical protein